ncbi:MAG: sulfur carrier protein ThiS [Halothiobacillaceae bacterium]|nr:sulfur carrier protein ThiS [Halothiobacillaceae bacterium]HER34632.1 sulfur carrier protein ThiS [Halothiobacillaceae bacterium]
MAESTLRIELNGEPRDVPEGTTLEALVALGGTSGKRYAIEVNGEIRPRAEHASAVVVDGDRVEIVQAIGGG